jgi:hypothetical protein
MAKCYFELRKQGARGTDSLVADSMRHLHTRLHLGKAVLITSRDHEMVGPGRKQWNKLTRAIQKQRSATLNADKILKYTHTITRMQHMRFTSKTPLQDPEAEVHFLTPATAGTMPIHCYTVYVTVPLSLAQAREVIAQLPPEALIVDYHHHTPWASLGLQAKSELERQVSTEWRQVCQFLETHHINVRLLTPRDSLHDIEAMDDALDTLLSTSHGFMRVANDFQRALEHARPLRISRDTREEYDMIILLAHRVQALSPGIFTQRFLESYNEDDTFFLHDHIRRSLYAGPERLVEAVARHLAAGRPHLAHHLRLAFTWL